MKVDAKHYAIRGGLFNHTHQAKNGHTTPCLLFPKLLLKHVARMQRSGIREWRGSELPGLRYAPSGLRCFDSPEEVGSDLAAEVSVFSVALFRFMYNDERWSHES
ncbi:hypothetical protein [Methylotuvimicrobium sp. KM2]|uniref:hypothetical protein n=1 Tax=Methylotuvimicrobium sp. KM2 TaxID=3133976 RepID=UPI003100AC72